MYKRMARCCNCARICLLSLHCTLPGCQAGQHAVVVVAVETQNVTILDPAQIERPVVLTENEFLAAWIEMDCTLAYLVTR
jgi:ABC-type bacteriocin/lantibiotic exporter with double-glycine peptidase domain